MSPTPWTNLFPDARSFLAALKGNNSRHWFAAHKASYDSQLKAPALALLDVVSADLQRLTGHPTTGKLWRPQRDIRFSKDQTPYHLHLHMGWSSNFGGRQPLGWFLGISPDYVSVGAGVTGFDKAVLSDWRNAVAGHMGVDLEQAIQAALGAGFRLSDPELKRVPAPFDKAHPQADLLRRKGLVLWQDWQLPDPANDTEVRDLTARLAETFEDLLRIQNHIKSIL